MAEVWNGEKNEQSTCDQYDQSLLLLEEKVNVEMLPPDYRTNLINNVYGTDIENANRALENAKIKGRRFATKQDEENFKQIFIQEHAVENRIDTALETLDITIKTLQTLPLWKTYASFFDKTELLAIMSKESSFKLPDTSSAAGETGYFQLTPLASTNVKKIIGAFPAGISMRTQDCLMGVVGFLDYKKQTKERLSTISLPKLEKRMINKLVWLAYNKGITNTEKIIALSYQDAGTNNQAWTFDHIIKVLCTIANLPYTPSRKKTVRPSSQFLHLQVRDYGTNTDTTVVSGYPLSPYQASVGLRYMLTIEELMNKIGS